MTNDKISFSEMPSAGLWKNRPETVEEMLKELGGGWNGFGELEDYETSMRSTSTIINCKVGKIQ